MFPRVLLWSIVFLVGCTTVNDFKQMSAHERSVAVCKRQKDLHNIGREIASLQESIADSQNALARGYRVHTQCHQVEILGDASISCNKFYSTVNCSETRQKSYKTECTETPVSINSDLERQNISNWSQSVESLKSQEKEKAQRCYEFIFPMSPEQAYKYYYERAFVPDQGSRSTYSRSSINDDRPSFMECQTNVDCGQGRSCRSRKGGGTECR